MSCREKDSIRFGALLIVSATLIFLASPGPAGADTGAIWKKKAIMGFSMTSGNSDTLNYNVSLTAKKDEGWQSLLVGAESAYGETEGSRTTDNNELYGKYQREISDLRYGSLWSSFSTDAANDTDYRFIISPAYGHYFIKDPDVRLKADVGPSFIREKVGRTRDSIFTLRVGEQYNRTLSPTAKLWQTAEFLPDLEDSEFLLNAEIGMESVLAESMNLRVVLRNKLNSAPAAGKKKNDLALISSVSYDF